MSQFRWNEKRSNAAILLAEGTSVTDTAKIVGVTRRTIQRWNCDIDFQQEVDRLTLMVGIANRAHRIRIARDIIQKKLNQEEPSKKDLLDWLRYAQTETDGVKLDLTALYEATALVAGGGPGGDDKPKENQDKQ